MQRGLGFEGYRVQVAASGEDALAAAREPEPDLIRLDLMRAAGVGIRRPGRVERHRRPHSGPAREAGGRWRAAPDPDRSRGRLRAAGSMTSLSLRLRLTLWYGLLLALSLVAFASLVYLVLRAN